MGTAAGVSLDVYGDILGAAAVDKIRDQARFLAGARILHLSLANPASHHSRMLDAAIPLLSGLGIDVQRRSPQASGPDLQFFDALHSAIDGANNVWNEESNAAWHRFARRQAAVLDRSYDLVVVHDLQLLRLRAAAARTATRAQWIWHCHMDLRECDETVADLVTTELTGFSQVAIEHPAFAGTIGMPSKVVIPPVIDPLSRRNGHLPPRVIDAVLGRFDLNPDWPLMLEVSTYDGWDDPQWAFWVYEVARKEIPNLQMALVATLASTEDVFAPIRGRCTDNVKLLNAELAHDVEINALQGKAVVAMQNAVRRGFSTSLMEAWWKGRPVLASEGGAMSHQVEHGSTGYLFATFEDAAERIVRLVQDPSLADAIGFNGHRLVRESHLVIRWVEAYLGFLSQSRRADVRPTDRISERRDRSGGRLLHV